MVEELPVTAQQKMLSGIFTTHKKLGADFIRAYESKEGRDLPMGEAFICKSDLFINVLNSIASKDDRFFVSFHSGGRSFHAR